MSPLLVQKLSIVGWSVAVISSIVSLCLQRDALGGALSLLMVLAFGFNLYIAVRAYLYHRDQP